MKHIFIVGVVILLCIFIGISSNPICENGYVGGVVPIDGTPTYAELQKSGTGSIGITSIITHRPMGV